MYRAKTGLGFNTRLFGKCHRSSLRFLQPTRFFSNDQQPQPSRSGVPAYITNRLERFEEAKTQFLQNPPPAYSLQGQAIEIQIGSETHPGISGETTPLSLLEKGAKSVVCLVLTYLSLFLCLSVSFLL